LDSELKIAKPMQNTDDKLTSRNIKPTAMRELVLDILTEQKMAISLSDLEQKFHKSDKVTLYRTLKTFEEKKLIHSINDGSGAVKYALCKESCQCHPEDLHVHFFCLKCQHTFCLSDIPIPPISLPVNFSMENTNMVVKGICASCND
jgi:Fur family ferric uptake transcriptional regulator